MGGGRSSRRSQVLAALLAGALLFLALRGVNWREMLEIVQRGQPSYLVITFTMLTATLFIRGLRWRILLSAEKHIAVLTVFWATSAGYLANNFLPARAGELIRSVLIGRAANTSKSLVLATALTERVIDVVALVLFGLLAVSTLKDIPDWLLAAMRLMGIAGVLGLVGLVIVSRLEGPFNTIILWLPLPKRLQSRFINVGGQFLIGTRSFQHQNIALGFVALTILVWVVDGLGVVIVARALNLPPLNLRQALLLLTALGLSSAVPSTPGYIGVYQFVAVTLLPSFHFSQSEALTYVIVLQGLGYAVVTLCGLLGLWQLDAIVLPKWISRASRRPQRFPTDAAGIESGADAWRLGRGRDWR